MTCGVIMWAQSDGIMEENQISVSTGLIFCMIVVLQELHIVVVVMMSP